MNAHATPWPEAVVRESDLVVDGIRCAGCIAIIERKISAVPGVRSARINFTTRRLGVTHDPSLAADDLIAVLADLGYPAHELVTEAASDSEESQRLARSLAVAAFAAMNVMLLSVSIWSGADGAARQLFHWLSALIALPAIAYAGRPFFSSAVGALRRGRTNMDVPISIGVTLVCAMSLYETVIGGPHAYFDGAIMLIAILLGGRLLDSVMRDRALDGVTALLRRLPAEASVRQPDGTVSRVALSMLRPESLVMIAAGERIGVDGVVEEGRSDVDQSLVTGESMAQPIEPGSRVLAGTTNTTSPIVVRCTAAAQSTVIADIARLMEAAGQGRSRYVRLADRAARLYAPAVHLLAAGSLAGWLIAGAGLHQALTIAVAVLIITCPCALGLAVPIAQVVATASLMRRGILIRDGAALEKLADVDMVLLDKTGTVTMGKAIPVDGLPTDAEERSTLLALAQATRHPLAVSIAKALTASGVSPAMLTDVRETIGKGVEGRAGDVTAKLGLRSWVSSQRDAASVCRVSTSFKVGRSSTRHITFADELRVDATDAIDRLREMRILPQFVSGDSWVVVQQLARKLGVLARARLSPADKHEAVQRLEQGGHRVLMVGDGLNDGPALKRAWVAMAPAAACDVGRQAADVIFFGERLMPVPVAVAAARRTRTVVQQNIALAVGYNLLAVPLAILGFVTPLVAALAMSASSLLVVGNALRLGRAAR